MKSAHTILWMFVMVIVAVGFRGVDTDTSSDEFSEARKNLEEALDSRDFHEAKILIETMFPLMKEEVKNGKRELSELKKTNTPEAELDKLKNGLDRQSELIDDMKHIVKASPAAIRAKVSLIRDMIKEFDELSINS